METTHWTDLVVSPAQIDQYGHLNNAAYMSLLEEARWQWLHSAGIPKSSLEEEGMGPVVLDAHLQFKRELKSGARIKIATRITRFRPPLFDIFHEIRNEADEVCCTANYRLGFFHLKERRLVRPSQTWLKAFEGYKR